VSTFLCAEPILDWLYAYLQVKVCTTAVSIVHSICARPLLTQHAGYVNKNPPLLSFENPHLSPHARVLVQARSLPERQHYRNPPLINTVVARRFTHLEVIAQCGVFEAVGGEAGSDAVLDDRAAVRNDSEESH
jgi:hypothetical protein